MSKVLFTLLKSPFEKNEIRTMEIMGGENEKGVLLFEDAVYYASFEPTRQELLSRNFSIFAMKEELETTFIFATHDHRIVGEAEIIYTIEDGVIVDQQSPQKGGN